MAKNECVDVIRKIFQARFLIFFMAVLRLKYMYRADKEKKIRRYLISLFIEICSLKLCELNKIIENVSSCTSHINTLSLRLSAVFTSVREFKKILPNTYIYESILIKYFIKLSMTSTVIQGHKMSLLCLF